MMAPLFCALLAILLVTSAAAARTPSPSAQTPPSAGRTTTDPFPDPIPANEDVVTVSFVEFATLPDVDGGPARMMLLVDEPGTKRLFVSDMNGILYSVSYDGRTVTPYLDLRDPAWNVSVQASGDERGFQSFAFHPEFGRAGARGFGKFYTYTDTSNTAPEPDFVPGGGDDTHDTVLLEWTAKDPTADAYDGGPPRELLRIEQPFRNHNAGHVGFNPLASPGDEDYGLLYVGSADGGSGGDPMDLAQNPKSIFGKILRIDPLGSNSANGEYGIPDSNPFAGGEEALGEIYASGVRNPQRLWWDPKTGAMYVADIGQNIVEEVSPVTKGANLGWNEWEASFRFISRQAVSLENRRGDDRMTYPVAEYGQIDPLLRPSCCAATGGFVYRSNAIPQLANLFVFGDNPSGEVFYVDADNLPDGGQAAIRRILFNDNGTPKRLLQLIQEKNRAQSRPVVDRADLRFGVGNDDRIVILNKGDGVIRLLVPDGAASR